MDLGALTLHQLRIFHAVADHANLTRAAEQLGISQPAVSIQIKHLERILGLPLLETVGRGQQLTELGLSSTSTQYACQRSGRAFGSRNGNARD